MVCSSASLPILFKRGGQLWPDLVRYSILLTILLNCAVNFEFSERFKELVLCLIVKDCEGAINESHELASVKDQMLELLFDH